jgi:hypothetical protein
MGGIGMKKVFVAAATVAVFALLVSSPAYAGPSKPSGTLAMTSQTARLVAGSGPAYGQASGFDASYQGVKQQDKVRVQVICMQNGGVVYGDVADLTGSPSTVWFTLGQPANGTSVWTSGEASCRSDLYTVSGGNKVTYLATVGFMATG